MNVPFVDIRWALLAAPGAALVVAALVLWSYRRRAQRLRRLASESLVARLVPPSSSRAPWIRALLQGAAVLCAGIAFAGPRWGTERTVERRSGVDMVLALDASLSMLATDVRPNRLERMKEEARRLLALSTGDRIGLLAFAGRSYILTPLTIDRGALELFLDNLDPSVVGQAGSSLSRAIRQGTDLLVATQTVSDRALVVMSDGEAFEPIEEVTAAATHAAESGVTLITVGFGTEQGTTIPVRSSQGTTAKRDENGQIVTTRYTPASLQAAVTSGRGVFIDAAATDKAVRIRGALARLRRQARATESENAQRARFQLFVIPALLFTLLDSVLAERRGRRRRAPAAAATTAVTALLLLVPAAAHAQGESTGDRLYRAGRYAEAAAAYQRVIRSTADSPRLEYDLGTALMAAGHLDEAVSVLERVVGSATSPELRYRALYNLGLAYLRQARDARPGDASNAFAASVEAYKRALQMRPGERDAKWNYELAVQEKSHASGGGSRPQQKRSQSEQQRPSSGLDRRQAEELLSSAQREERDVQARKQRENQPERPPAGKDW
ncbi:MAG: VWA domain-containing protein [Chloroflexota bacterium]|nr:VWA domain-containing protein [Chloroflexota bacterium]